MASGSVSLPPRVGSEQTLQESHTVSKTHVSSTVTRTIINSLPPPFDGNSPATHYVDPSPAQLAFQPKYQGPTDPNEQLQWEAAHNGALALGEVLSKRSPSLQGWAALYAATVPPSWRRNYFILDFPFLYSFISTEEQQHSNGCVFLRGAAWHYLPDYCGMPSCIQIRQTVPARPGASGQIITMGFDDTLEGNAWLQAIRQASANDRAALYSRIANTLGNPPGNLATSPVYRPHSAIEPPASGSGPAGQAHALPAIVPQNLPVPEMPPTQQEGPGSSAHAPSHKTNNAHVELAILPATMTGAGFTRYLPTNYSPRNEEAWERSSLGEVTLDQLPAEATAMLARWAYRWHPGDASPRWRSEYFVLHGCLLHWFLEADKASHTEGCLSLPCHWDRVDNFHGRPAVRFLPNYPPNPCEALAEPLILGFETIGDRNAWLAVVETCGNATEERPRDSEVDTHVEVAAWRNRLQREVARRRKAETARATLEKEIAQLNSDLTACREASQIDHNKWEAQLRAERLKYSQLEESKRAVEHELEQARQRIAPEDNRASQVQDLVAALEAERNKCEALQDRCQQTEAQASVLRELLRKVAPLQNEEQPSREAALVELETRCLRLEGLNSESQQLVSELRLSLQQESAARKQISEYLQQEREAALGIERERDSLLGKTKRLLELIAQIRTHSAAGNPGAAAQSWNEFSTFVGEQFGLHLAQNSPSPAQAGQSPVLSVHSAGSSPTIAAVPEVPQTPSPNPSPRGLLDLSPPAVPLDSVRGTQAVMERILVQMQRELDAMRNSPPSNKAVHQRNIEFLKDALDTYLQRVEATGFATTSHGDSFRPRDQHTHASHQNFGEPRGSPRCEVCQQVSEAGNITPPPKNKPRRQYSPQEEGPKPASQPEQGPYLTYNWQASLRSSSPPPSTAAVMQKRPAVPSAPPVGRLSPWPVQAARRPTVLPAAAYLRRSFSPNA
eukprot:TRINITY_DN2052_c0_g1_i1.p1 TRINITY_DN2052_c0_g1~~TRINITY_DN2052_c0_g1_i1.p1  ORF type:complete len:961 (-),score=119.54 TRINITY_DN2052_c0_g1_i1:445-3327(-)